MKRERSNPSQVLHLNARSHSESLFVRNCKRKYVADRVKSMVACRHTKCGLSSMHASAESLPFYGFFATTAFDRSSMTVGECIVLASEMAMDFYSELKMLYDMTIELRFVNQNTKRMEELVNCLRSALNDSQTFPVASESDDRIAGNVKSVYRGLIQVYLFLFQQYYSIFVALDVANLLSACWQRLLAFAMEYKVLEDEFIQQAYHFHIRCVSVPSST